jgi:hypothetical protein
VAWAIASPAALCFDREARSESWRRSGGAAAFAFSFTGAGAGATIMLLITVLTPATEPLSAAANAREAALVAVPLSVTTPLATLTSIGCPSRAGSAAILA